MPTIAVLEEAQSVLGRRTSEESPFVQWAKEGRKYGLGAIMVTQQPGSMAPELLSQGDNFFTFHLLSADDLKTLQRHNAHFSDDILASVLNEPIKGNCFFWSAPDQPFVLPARILDFGAVGTDVPAADAVSETVDVKASKVDNEARSAETQLVQALIDTIKASERKQGVEFYSLPSDDPDLDGMVACYGPRLAAQVADKLSDADRTRFTSGDGTYVQDSYLKQALQSSGIVKSVQQVQGQRNGKVGNYYLVPKKQTKLRPREALVLVD